MNDLAYGLWVLARTPGFTLVAGAALALGIGANTAIFSLVDALLLRPLPYQDPDRVVMVWENFRARDQKHNVISPANFLDWKAQNPVFENMAGLMYFSRVNLTGSGEPEELPVHQVTSDFFPLLGVSPALGRTIQPADDKPGAPAVCVLSHKLWQRRFGGEASIVGKAVTLNGAPVTVAGVMPAGFYFLKREAELWTPLQLNPARDYRKNSGRFMAAVARLKPGVSLAAAQSGMDSIATRLERDFPEFHKGWGVNIVAMREEMAGAMRLPLLVLTGAVGFVLLIACANVANLLLTRAASREREIAVRASLGASRWRLARQLLSESLILALAGGAAGVLVAYWGLDLLVALSPKDLAGVDSARIDARVLGFTLLLSLATAGIFGLAPAIAAAGASLTGALKEGGASGVSVRGRLLRDAFAVAEVALALVLLSGAGLLIRSFVRLQSVDPGLNAHNVLTFPVQLPRSNYGEPAARSSFFRQALARMEALPGVKSAGAVSFLPFRGSAAGTGFRIQGRPEPAAGEQPYTVVRSVLPGYLKTMGIPLKRGRDFTWQDSEASAPPRFLISEAFARKYFPGEDPLGRFISVDMVESNPYGEIVGVTGDLKEGSLDREALPTVYYIHKNLNYSFMNVVLRTWGDPASLAGAVRATMRSLDSALPVADLTSMESVLAETLARSRFQTALLALFSGLAVLLAGIGIFGVLSYAVALRRREIGLRVALGARPGSVLRLVIGRGMLLAGAGIAIGLGASLALTRVLSKLLFEIKPTDPVTLGSVAALLAAIALGATWVPAWRATRVDPMVVLRYE